MALKLKYQGQQQSRTRDEFSYRETYYGTEAEVDYMINGDSTVQPVIAGLKIGTYTADKGYLRSWRKSQMQGPFYQLQLEYGISYDSETDDLDEAQVGKKSAQLSVRNIQLPLERHPKYLANWNNFLAGRRGTVTPAWWETAKNIKISDANSGSYKWVKYRSDCPEGWKILQSPTKKGVQFYDWSTYVVTESAKFRSSASAGNYVQKKINTIIKPDNDFSISGGNWKMDEVSVSWTGSFWIASMTYTRSGDNNGWDKDLYGE